MPRALWLSYGAGRFLMGEVALYGDGSRTAEFPSGESEVQGGLHYPNAGLQGYLAH